MFLFSSLVAAWLSPVHAALPPVVDLSQDTGRQVIVAQGTPEIYQGHPTTVLLPDGKTIYCVWTYGHGGGCGPMKRSDDGGKTWSGLLPVPENWSTTRNCPALYRLTDPQGVARLFVFAGQGPGGTRHPDNGGMHQAYSLDDGKTWSPMTSNGLDCVMPFCTIMPVDGGKRLIGLSNIRRPGETKDPRSNIVTQSESTDGGLTWSPWRVLVDLGDLKPCEPEVVRSPDGKQLLCLIRENIRSHGSHYITSEDEGRTWTQVKTLPPGLHGDRHKAQYAPDGRLVVTFRDMGADSPTRNHFVAWVGRYEDILSGKDGEYKIKLLHSHARSDCGYPGLEILPDGTFVATSYVKYREGPEKHSVVSTRFQLKETDAMDKTSASELAGTKGKIVGILLDDEAASYEGEWLARGSKIGFLVGRGYHTTNMDGKATFKPEIPTEGRYEVRLLYMASANRSNKVQIKIRHAKGESVVEQDQQKECIEEAIPRSLGVFEFAKGKAGSVQVLAKAKQGYVVVDGLQLVPEADAKVERNTRADAGFPAQSSATLPKIEVKVPPPVLLKSAAAAKDVDGKSYDLVVIGGTPGGIATAVRAAREGLSVLLVNHTQHLGGFITSGAGGWEAPYDGLRSPLYAEMLRNTAEHYRKAYGENSPQHLASMPDATSRSHLDRPKVEPRVAEMLFNQMVENEKTLTVLLGHVVSGAQKEGRAIQQVRLKPLHGKGEITVSGKIFADAMYEGDLVAASGVESRIGRESREAYGEPHAGVIYAVERKKEPGQRGFPKDADEGRLNIRYNSHATAEILDGPNSGEGDASVMAYNYRLILTRNLANRIPITKPANYDVNIAMTANSGGFVPKLPNDKVAWNGGRIIGLQNGYPGGDWSTREEISKQYLEAMLMRLWWMQNDPEAPPAERTRFEGYGLAADEFPDNHHVPYEIYVREARRLVGRYVFKEQDNVMAAGTARTPVHSDSIAITDWPVDSVACLKRKVAGSHEDGIFFLGEETRPAQVPYRSLLAKEVDNLLVPVPLSASHVGWGSIRLEPVWMQAGESAGFAAALALKNNTTPGKLDPDLLIRELVNHKVMITFFNDVDVTSQDPRVPAAQYFGSKGFFSDYNARLDEPLKASLEAVWREGFAALKMGNLKAQELAKKVHAANEAESSLLEKTRGQVLMEMWKQIP